MQNGIFFCFPVFGFHYIRAETGETHFVQTRLQGLALVLIPLEDLHLKMMADGLFLMAFLTTILCFGISPTFKLFKGKCPHRCIHQNMNILRAIHVVLMCILTLVAFPWTMLPGPHFTPSKFRSLFHFVWDVALQYLARYAAQ